MDNANNKQIGGNHYKDTDIEPWDAVMSWGLGYLDGSAIKYIARWKKKGGIQDLQKAIHFLEKLIEVETRFPSAMQSNKASNHLATSTPHWTLDDVIQTWTARAVADEAVKQNVSQSD